VTGVCAGPQLERRREEKRREEKEAIPVEQREESKDEHTI
jgi:hypothetical protein